MAEIIEWIQALFSNYPHYQYLIIFLGAGFIGEPAILLFGFLAATGVLSIGAVIIFGVPGAFLSDCLWFWLGKTRPIRKLISHRHATTFLETIIETMRRASRGNYPLALVFAKFVTGTRIPMILHMSNNQFPFLKFMRFNTIATSFWASVVISIGFLSGLGFTLLSGALKSAYAGIGFIFLIVVAIILFQKWLKKRFRDKEEVK